MNLLFSGHAAAYSGYVLATALALDIFGGEFPNPIHPVVWMGWVISFFERLSPRTGPARQFIAGCFIAIWVPAIFVAGTILLLRATTQWPAVQFCVAVYLLKSMFALRALGKAARVVKHELKAENLDGARKGLRSLCSRDPSALQPPQLVAAAIESVAENASDSFVAPLFYFALLGLPGIVAYRAVNTLDAMIGYHGKYEYLGKASARLDDVLNFIPARLTALLLLLAGALSRKDFVLGWRTLHRDGSTTESPNAGRPMAAMAGLLRVELEKDGHYRLGQPIETLTFEKIDDAWRLVTISAMLCLAGLVAVSLQQ